MTTASTRAARALSFLRGAIAVMAWSTLCATAAHAADPAATTPMRWAIVGHEGDCVDLGVLDEFKRTGSTPMTLDQVRSQLGAKSVESIRVPSFKVAYRIAAPAADGGAILVVPSSDCPK